MPSGYTPPHDHSLDPCPYVILHHTGSGFVVGAVGGAIWHGIKGARNSPKGLRLNGALNGMGMRAPIAGGNFAAWSGLLVAFNCLAVEVRQKEDPWNWIMAGAGTGGCLAVRSGPRGVLGGAMAGACMIGVLEGFGAWLDFEFSKANKPVAPPLPELPSTSGPS